MRAVVWVGVVIACGKSAPHDAAVVAVKPPADAARADAAPVDAKVRTAAVDWWQAALAAIPTVTVAGDPGARYQLAATAAREGNRDRAIGILHAMVLEPACDTCADLVFQAMADDAFRPYWGTEVFRALIWSAEAHPEPGGTLACPAGTKQRGKLDDGGDGIVFCAKPDGTRSGPYIEHHSGCSLGEGGCGATGSYKNGARDGVWIEGGHYEVTTMQVYVAGIATGLERSWHKDLETWTFVDEKGRTDTTQITDDGHLIEHGLTVDGKPDGPYERYSREEPHPLVEKGAYVRGTKDGAWLAYEEGRLRAERSYAVGVPNGTFRYWDAAGKLLGTATLDHGTGAWVAYDGNTRTEEGALVNGVREGAWRIADSARSLAQGSYAKGLREGPWSERAGDVTESGAYRANKRMGVWVLGDAGGKKIGEGAYANGKREGAWTYWRPDGTLLAKGSFTADTRVGTWIVYDDDGATVDERLGFRGGVLATIDGDPADAGQVAEIGDFQPPHRVPKHY